MLVNLFEERLSVEDVSAFFDLINEEEVNLFTFQKRDGTLIGIKDFFKSYHYGKICRYLKSEKTEAENRFLLVYADCKLFLRQIAEEEENLREISRIEANWNDKTTTEISFDNTNSEILTITSNDEQKIILGAKSGSLTGSVDSSGFSRVKYENLLEPASGKIMGYLDPNTREKTHSITIEGGENVTQIKDNRTSNNSGTQKNKGKTVTTASNSSRDYINFVNLRLPKLRADFLKQFNILFHN